jgi:acyl carrier protein phosphodiesterase
VNFLAHFHQAFPDEGLIIGGLRADYLKGPLKGELPLNVERGISLHRAIDAFTDRHPCQTQCKKHFPAALKRYSGILLDLSFDHFLSLNWQKFHNEELSNFSQNIYSILKSGDRHLCAQSSQMAKRLEDFDILCLYHEWETVTKTAECIGERFKRGNPFVNIDTQMNSLYPVIEQAFESYYPDLCDFVEQIDFEPQQASITKGTP